MKEYEVYALKYAGPLHGSGALTMWMSEWDKVVERAYYFWLIKGEDDLVVVDAGVSPNTAEERGIAGYVNPQEMLLRVGVDSREVRNVILTHLHWDHANGINLFPNARVYVQQKEFRFWTEDPISSRPPFKLVCDDDTRERMNELEGSGRLVLLKGDNEILPGIECLLSPGHTIGLQAVAVQTGEGTAVLGSDCGHTFRNYQEDWPSALITDLVEWMKTYDRLRSWVTSMDLLFPGHDPLMTANFPAVAEDVTRLV